MKYASVCSGVEAATLGWEFLGWEPQWFSQFDPEHDYTRGPDFASAVLSHHYPLIPNLGDMTQLHSNRTFNESDFQVLVGGTPCQSFSIAGLRKGLDDPRGNLALEYVRILDIKRPRWFIWENVPGVLSSNGGRDFLSLIGAFTKIGYSVSWRVLDAQYFGVPQKRKRVFVVGHLGDWRRSAAVLFEQESVFWNLGKGEKKRKGSSSNPGASTPFDLRGFGDYGDGRTSSTLKKRDNKDATDLVVSVRQSNHSGNDVSSGPVSPTMDCSGPHAVAYAYSKSHRPNGNVDVRFTEDGLANTLTTGDGCGNQSTLNIVAYDTTQITNPNNRSNPQVGSPCHTLSKDQKSPAIVYRTNSMGQVDPQGDTSAALTTFTDPTTQFLQDTNYKLRRLTPKECERLQGFPDDYTNIPWKGKDFAPDGLRYSAVGNSMATPCMRWLGERIAFMDTIPTDVELNMAEHAL